MSFASSTSCYTLSKRKPELPTPLVSHWAVASDAAVTLVTKAVAELKSDPKIGRAEALRRSMLSLIKDGKGNEAYPAYWAPFVVVGEGGAAR
jgi:CHAT domain-containing protein